MTNKDRTGDQLVASIRKSKTGSVTRKTAVRRSTRKPAETASSKAARSVPAEKSGPAAMRGKAGNYSIGHRVWPD